MKKLGTIVGASLLLLIGTISLIKPVHAALSCANHELDWSQYPQFNDDGSTTYPFTATATDIDGSTLDVSVTMQRAGRDFVHVNAANTEFPGVVDVYMTNAEVYRYYTQGDTTNDTLIYNFSEDLTLNKFMFGGHRPSGGNFAYADLTFWDGPNGTGNKVLSKHPTGANSAVILANTGDPTTSAINILPISSGGNYPSTFLSTENSYTMVTYDGATPRPWTVLDMNGAVVRSMTWTLYDSSVDVSPQLTGSGSSGTETKVLSTARAGLVNNSVLSGYVGNFNFDVCETVNSIPTLSEWAFILLTMMLGFVGYRHGIERQS